MELFRFALETSFDELVGCVEKAKENPNAENRKEEVNYRLGTCLHWLVDYLSETNVIMINLQLVLSSLPIINSNIRPA